MSRTFHPFGRPGWERPITHSVHWRRWCRFKRANDVDMRMRWRWPKDERQMRNRQYRVRCRRLSYQLRFENVEEEFVYPKLLECYFGWYL